MIFQETCRPVSSKCHGTASVGDQQRSQPNTAVSGGEMPHAATLRAGTLPRTGRDWRIASSLGAGGVVNRGDTWCVPVLHQFLMSSAIKRRVMAPFTTPAVGGTEGQAYHFLDTLAYVRVSGEETDGRLSAVEMVLREGHAPPMHVHDSADETIHVIEGEVTAHSPEGTDTAEAGETVVLPRGEEHSLTADTQARVVTTTTPAGFEEFVTAVGEPTEDETVPAEPPGEAAIGRVNDLAPEHGISIVGPPPR